MHHEDPETIAHHREHADWGQFEVVIVHDEHGELGTVDRDFTNDYDASHAAREASVTDVGITAEVREIQS